MFGLRMFMEGAGCAWGPSAYGSDGMHVGPVNAGEAWNPLRASHHMGSV